MKTTYRHKALVLSDSLAMARSVDGKTLLTVEESWPHRLKTAMPHVEFAQASVGSITVAEFLHQIPYWKPFDPDVVIVQAGLNDCLDRALHRHELEFCKKYRKIGRWVQIITGKHAPFFRRVRKIHYTPEEEYRQALVQLRHSFRKVILLGIVVDRLRPMVRFPHCLEKIDRFNAVGASVFGEDFISLDILGYGQTQDDQFHVKAEGHDRIKKTLQPILSKALGAAEDEDAPIVKAVS